MGNEAVLAMPWTDLKVPLWPPLLPYTYCKLRIIRTLTQACLKIKQDNALKIFKTVPGIHTVRC